MLNEYERAKLIEWAEWHKTQPDDGIMPHGIRVIDLWLNNVPFPTAEQMEPTPADFGLDD